MTDTLPPWVAEDYPLDSPDWITITGAAAAETAMARIAVLDAEIDVNLARYEQWKEQLDAWLSNVQAKPSSTREFHAGRLIDYQRRRREQDPKARSLRLPSGTVKSTYHAERPKVVDSDALGEWARDHVPEMVEVTWRLPARAVKDLVTIEERFGAASVVLACGHTVVSEETIPEVGEIITCPTCSLDGDEMVTSAVVSTEIHTLRVVRYKGAEVPGVVPEPEHVVLTVAPK